MSDTTPPATPPFVPAPPRRRRRRWFTAALVVAIAASAGWRYRVTRAEYRFARGEEALRAGDAEAVRYYADRLQAAGAADHAHLLRGEGLLKFGSPGPALTELNRVEPSGPLRFRAALLSGQCLLALGELREAQRVFGFVATEQSDNPDAYRGLAAVAYDLGHLDVALSHLNRVAELDPADGRPYRLIGLISKDMGQVEKAAASYEEALRRGMPEAMARECRVEFTEVLIKQARFAEALDTLGPPSADEDAAPATVALRAEALRGAGRVPEAAELLTRATARHQDATLYRLQGQICFDRDQKADAARLLEEAIRLAPTDYQTQYLLAQTYAALGRKGDADRGFARAEEIRKEFDRLTALTNEAQDKPWDAEVRLQLAEIFDRQGKPQLAGMWRKAAAACVGRKS